MKQIARKVVALLGILLTALTWGSFLGQFHWLLDLLSSFNLQYTLGLGICLALSGLLTHRRWAVTLVMISALVANGYLLLPFFMPIVSPPSSATDILRVSTVNIFTENDDYDTVIQHLRTHEPDVVLLIEAEPALMQALEEIQSIYPHIYDESVNGTTGFALLSKHPFLSTTTVSLDSRRRRLITAEITWQDKTVAIYGVHPLPPLRRRWAESRNRELETIAALVAQESDPFILLGDFNATPWSHSMKPFNQIDGLRHAALGFGLWPTWHYGSPLLSIPIDHVFISSDWQTMAYGVQGDIGSDHYPVTADLTWSPRKTIQYAIRSDK